MTGFGFSSQYKIKKTDDFSSVFNFRKRISGRFVILHYMPTAGGFARLGLIVGKKTARRSVQRNYMKRVLRELFREKKHDLGGVDVLLRVHKPFTRKDRPAVLIELEQLFAKLNARSSPREP